MANYIGQGGIFMFGVKKYKFLEVNGERYLCSYWFSEEDNLWYGESLDTSLYPTRCQAEELDSLWEKIKEQIKIDLQTK